MRYILLMLSFFIFPIGAHAQEVNLGISPLRHEIIAKPAATITVPYTLTNYGDATLVTIKIVRLETADSLGNYTLLPLVETDLPQPQLFLPEVSIEPFLMLAKEEYTGQILVEIPSETKERDYYYALVAQSQNSQGFETSSTIKLHGGVATPIFISVTNNGNTQTKISDPLIQLDTNHIFTIAGTTQLVVDRKKPLSGSIIVENNGKNIASVKGTIRITSSFSLSPFKGFVADIPPLTILAGSRRVLTLPTTPTVPPGRYVLSVAASTSAQDTQTSTVSFIVFPVALIMYGFIILFLGLLSFFGYKRYTNT